MPTPPPPHPRFPVHTPPFKSGRACSHRPGMANRMLTLGFLRPPPGDILENRLTAAVSPHGICHAELVFENGVAFSIIQEEEVASLRQRTLSNPRYETVTLSVPAAEYHACLSFCKTAHNARLTFDSFGMYLCTVHPGCMQRSSLELGKTFCSKIITEALSHAGAAEVEGLNPSATTPSSLYAAVRASPRRMCHSVRIGSHPLKLSCVRSVLTQNVMK